MSKILVCELQIKVDADEAESQNPESTIKEYLEDALIVELDTESNGNPHGIVAVEADLNTLTESKQPNPLDLAYWTSDYPPKFDSEYFLEDTKKYLEKLGCFKRTNRKLTR